MLWKLQISYIILKKLTEKKNGVRKFLTFDGNIYQRELLYKKPKVFNTQFPKNILNFTKYRSVTSYGIFYVDKVKGEIDFLYTLPEFIEPSITATSKNRRFRFDCSKTKVNISLLSSPIYDELLCTGSIDDFMKYVLAAKLADLDSISNIRVQGYTLDISKFGRNDFTNYLNQCSNDAMWLKILLIKLNEKLKLLMNRVFVLD